MTFFGGRRPNDDVFLRKATPGGVFWGEAALVTLFKGEVPPSDAFQGESDHGDAFWDKVPM